MKLIYSLFLLSLVSVAAQDMPAPTIVQIQKQRTNLLEVSWTWPSMYPEVLAFEITRRVNGATEETRRMAPYRLRPSHIRSTALTTYRYADQKVREGVEYTYVVRAIGEEKVSDESNALTFPNTVDRPVEATTRPVLTPPATPELLFVRHLSLTDVELLFAVRGPTNNIEAFQIGRSIDGSAGRYQIVGLHRLQPSEAGTDRTLYRWVDKGARSDTPCYYTVITMGSEGTVSLPSNKVVCVPYSSGPPPLPSP